MPKQGNFKYLQKKSNFEYLRVIQTKTLTKTFSMNFCFEKQKRLTKRFDHFFVCKQNTQTQTTKKKRFPVAFCFVDLVSISCLDQLEKY